MHFFPRLMLFLALGITSLHVSSQHDHSDHENHFCPVDLFLSNAKSESKERNKIIAKTEKWLENKDLLTSKNNQQIVIPVVVHVLYSNSYENISTAQINDQLSILNRDFNKQNDIQASLANRAANVNIRFELATTDPAGNPTGGVIRKSTFVSPFNIDFAKSYDQSPNVDMKNTASGGSDAWPNDQYLNIWVCELQTGLRGFATFPNSVSDAHDGVVINYEYFGSIGTGNDNSNYAGGRTLTHEVGHWLSLRHIWGKSGCSIDDGIEDTPEQNTFTSGCPGISYSCGSYDLWQNFMDYTYDDCLQLFTEGQKNMMRSVFEPGGPRADFQHQLSLGLLGDRVWEDQNMDGIQQTGEPGIANIEVRLYDMDYNIIKTENTDALGNYLIDEIPVGEYFLEFVDPSGLLSFTTANNGPNSLDSDVDHTNGLNTTAAFVINPGEYLSDVDAGLVNGTLAALQSELKVIDDGDLLKIDYQWLFTDPIDQIILEQSENTSEFTQVEDYIEEIELYGSWVFSIPKSVEDRYLRIKTVARNGRIDYSNIVFDSGVPIMQVDVDIYPNPTSEYVNIHINESTGMYSISIYDMSGKLLDNWSLSAQKADASKTLKINLEGYKSGLYNISIKKDNSHYSKLLYVKD